MKHTVWIIQATSAAVFLYKNNRIVCSSVITLCWRKQRLVLCLEMSLPHGRHTRPQTSRFEPRGKQGHFQDQTLAIILQIKKNLTVQILMPCLTLCLQFVSKQPLDTSSFWFCIRALWHQGKNSNRWFYSQPVEHYLGFMRSKNIREHQMCCWALWHVLWRNKWHFILLNLSAIERIH